jgi:TetR/AcrR family transcriptional regulator
MSKPNITRAQADRSEETRSRILDAATREFSANGLAGARTERIAEAAGVNKALLYYYFRGKDALYAAALEAVADRVAANSLSVLSRDCSPGERLVRVALSHFDRIYSQSIFQTLLQHEMVRLREDKVPSPLIERLFKPMTIGTIALATEGIRTGELIGVESTQVVHSVFGPNVFYFLTAPMMAMLAAEDLLSAAALSFRRKAVVEFLGQALFSDRRHGAAVAARVLADVPMPERIELPRDWFRKDKAVRKIKTERQIDRPAEDAGEVRQG